MDLNKKLCGKKEYCLNILKDSEGFLPISEFYTDKHKESGYRSECKKCCNKPPKLSSSLKTGRDTELIEKYKKGIKIKELMLFFNIAETSVHRILKINKITRIDSYENLTGQVFNRLTVIGKTKLKGDTSRYWDCICECGKKIRVQTRHLKSGHTKSCGCYSAEMTSQRFYKHGKTISGEGGKPTDEYLIWSCAKARAKKQTIPFDLEVGDIVIPDICPVLGIKLQKNIGKMGDNSPTLDKIVPELGYVKDNIAIISLKANRMKGAANLEEINQLSRWVETKTFEDSNKENSTFQEWVNMPEFIQDEQKPYAKIIVRVTNQEDLDALSQRLEQELTPKTKSIWYPKLIRGKDSARRWIDES